MVALVCLAMPVTSFAQKPISLSDAVKQALENHEDAEIALLRLKQAEARERQGSGSALSRSAVDLSPFSSGIAGLSARHEK